MDILQEKISNKHLDSFWYEGLIADTDNYELLAVGEIIVLYKDEKLNEQQALEVAEKNNWTDKDLKNFQFDYNNWFEVMSKDGESYFIADNYDEGVELLAKCEKEHQECEEILGA